MRDVRTVGSRWREAWIGTAVRGVRPLQRSSPGPDWMRGTASASSLPHGPRRSAPTSGRYRSKRWMAGCPVAWSSTGLRCASCVWLVEGVLQRTDGVSQATVSYATGRAHVVFDPNVVSIDTIGRRISGLGYAPRAVDGPSTADREWTVRLGVAAFCAAKRHAAVRDRLHGMVRGHARALPRAVPLGSARARHAGRAVCGEWVLPLRRARAVARGAAHGPADSVSPWRCCTAMGSWRRSHTAMATSTRW